MSKAHLNLFHSNPVLRTVSSVSELRDVVAGWRKAGETIGFVPTMGALHDGHIELVRQAQKRAKRTVVSIFVNPLQFGPHEDLARYPRPLEADQKRLNDAGADLLFTPSVETMYPEGFVTKIDPGPIATVLEGAVRPGHFCGVATVVAKLLLMVLPDIACFGEKDYQQLQIIKQLVRDLEIPVDIVPVPIVREKDGLALSSRNAYLSEDERARAIELSQSLFECAQRLQNNEAVDAVLKAGWARLEKAGFKPDYLVLADGRTLAPLASFQSDARLLAAAKMGTTRLIDNMGFDAESG